MADGMELLALMVAARRNPAPLSEWESAFLESMAGRKSATQRQIALLQIIARRRPVAEIVDDLRGRFGELVVTLCGARPSERKGTTLRVGKKGSLAIEMEGAKAGTFYDHESDVGGGALRLVEHVRQCSTAEAVEWALHWLGGARHDLPPAAVSPPASALHQPSQTLSAAQDAWRDAVSPAGTVVETYLASRGLDLPAAPVLRFHRACPRGADRLPAMLALMTDPVTGEPCGVHRTFLRADGVGKADGNAKMMLGSVGVIRLVPDVDVAEGLGLAEGIETALAVMQGFEWRPVWAATSAGAIARFPVLPGIECLTVFADADQAGQDAARACIARWCAADREARSVAPPAGDWNDATRGAAA